VPHQRHPVYSKLTTLFSELAVLTKSRWAIPTPYSSHHTLIYYLPAL
jgi:hypothetical protein